jgi:hypothetical protein
VKINEEMIAAHRPTDWPALIGLPGVAAFASPLPGHFFSSSHDLFPELADDSGDTVAMLAFTTSLPTLAPRLEWLAVDHQSGGLCCDHPHFVGLRLAIRPAMVEPLRNLARHYYEAAGGHFYSANVLASDIVSYVGKLADLGVTCDRSYRLLQEGVYPIDATPEALALIADNPPELDIVQDRLGYGGLAILILAENSD